MQQQFQLRQTKLLRQWVHLGCVAILGIAVAVGLNAAADNTVDVTVRCSALAGQSGVQLRVLLDTALGVWPAPQLAGTTFDNAGECHLKIPPGEYVFEVGHVADDTIYALRTAPRRISRTSLVELQAAPAISLTTNSDQTVQIDELAIRSAATMGEVQWTGNSDSQPALVISPGQEYRARILGHGDDFQYAIWQGISTTKSVLRLKGEGICRCKFKIRTDGPQLTNAAVRFQFPDAEKRFPVTDKTVFCTNRHFVSYGYAAELSNGRRIAVRPWLGLVREQQEFVLGGPFTADAWAKVMVRKPVGGPETKHLVWDAHLYDGQGHLVLEDKSQIDFQQNIRSLSGAEVPRGRALTKEDIVSFLARQDAVVVDISYTLESPTKMTLLPKRFETYGKRRFYTHAPPNWELQAINYLARAERVYHMIEDLENKPSKHRVEVRWHAMNGTAWGCGPADNKAHIMMPFSGLKNSFDFYESPWALAHEMLHTFGYGHGEAMNRMSSLVEKRFDQFRWYMADHPELDPDTAFKGFRIATHIDRATAPPGPPIIPMKKGNSGKKKKSGK